MSKRKLDSFSQGQPESKHAKTVITEINTDQTMSIKINPPDLKSAKNYECFKNELLLWQSLTSLEPTKQAGCVALNLPNDCPFAKDIRTKVMEKMTVQQLKAETGFDDLIKVLDEELLQPEIEQAVEDWDNLENRFKSDSETIDEFVNDFERLLSRVENKGAKLPSCVKCFMMLKRIKLSHEERLIVLSKLDFDNKDDLFTDVKKCLKLLKGKPMSQTQSLENSTAEVLFTHRERGRGQRRGHRGGGGTSRAGSGTWKEARGSGTSGQYERGRKRSNSGNIKKKVNPTGADGNIKRCKSCESIRHLLPECPDSYENMQEAHVTELDTVGEEDYLDEEMKECFITESSSELKRFCVEAKNCAALDSCCTGVVCGEQWLKTFVASLSESSRKMIIGPVKSNCTFKFGNQQKLTSIARYKLPVSIGGRSLMIDTEVIKSDIPMLLSKQSMKDMGMVLNFINDTAVIDGQKINLSETSSGHYIIPLLADEQEIHVTLQLDEDRGQMKKKIVKLHRQFAHPGKESFTKILKQSKLYDVTVQSCIDEIYANCDICLQTAKTPARPVVCMPMAQEFNDVISIDLKLWRGKYILHMIDMFTRYSVSCFIPNKEPKTIVDHMLKHWMAYFGHPTKAILNDNGGEFVGQEMLQLKSYMDVRNITTGAEAPFQNGLCERNHAVVDSMLVRLVLDNPNMEVDTLLKWANMAKNCLLNVHGFSPNQLVFGKNPKLGIMAQSSPSSISKVSSDVLAKHINALKSAREAFIKSESCERIRRALNHKMRASEEKYFPGDEVYYKRENSELWLGPGKVVFQDGKVVFIRNGHVYVRASVNKIIRRGAEFQNVCSGSTELQPITNQEPGQNQNPRVEETFEQAPAGEPGEQPEEHPQPPPQVQAEVRDILKLQKHDQIEIKDNKTGKWTEAEIVNRAVKLSSNRPDKNWFNVKTVDNTFSVNLDEVPFKLMQTDANEVLFTEIIPRSEFKTKECIDAKKAEIEKIDNFNSFEVVNKQDDWTILGHTWVLVRKNGKVRARLTAKGFQEEIIVRSDSPTVGKSTFRTMLTIAVSNNWDIKTTDITSAFLQGDEIDREIYMKPPPEAGLHPNQVWKLTKPLYGLNDASRKFYLKVVRILKQCGCIQSLFDSALFYFKNEAGELSGIVGTHVDDFIHAGNDLFERKVMNVVNKSFTVGSSEKSTFKYTGFQITQSRQMIKVDQLDYVEKMKIKTPSQKKKKSDLLNEEEISMLRSNVGALQWVARGTRPDLGFEAIDLSTRFTKATYEDLHRSIKALKRLKVEKDQCMFLVPDLGDQKNWKLEVSTDASWGNCQDGICSMSGHVVLLVGKNGRTVPLAWESGKIQRVVNSTLAAEMLACKKGLEDAFYLKTILEEINGNELEVHGWVDHKGVVQSINSTNTIVDKRLRIDTAMIRQMLDKKEISSVSHCPGKDQLADCLTKRGANGSHLLETINTGKIVKLE